MILDFCAVCDEATRHDVREETFFHSGLGELMIDYKWTCRECGITRRKEKPKKWS